MATTDMTILTVEEVLKQEDASKKPAKGGARKDAQGRH